MTTTQQTNYNKKRHSLFGRSLITLCPSATQEEHENVTLYLFSREPTALDSNFPERTVSRFVYYISKKLPPKNVHDSTIIV